MDSNFESFLRSLSTHKDNQSLVTYFELILRNVFADHDRQTLISHLLASRILLTRDHVVDIWETSQDVLLRVIFNQQPVRICKVIWVETGSDKCGMTHILECHLLDFKKVGVSVDDIGPLIKKAIVEGTLSGWQCSTRPVFQVSFRDEMRRIAIQIGSNGFVVSANPKTMKERDTRNKVKRRRKDKGDPSKEGDTSMEKGGPGKGEREPGKEEGDPSKEEGESGKEEGDPNMEEGVDVKNEGVDVLIFADYGVSPFWVIEPDGLMNCSPRLFVKDLRLVQALEEWSNDSTADYLTENPGAMRPSPFRERLFLEFLGIVLSHEIEKDLNSVSPKYTVQFHSSLLSKRSSDFRSLIEQMATLVADYVEDESEYKTQSKIVAKHLDGMRLGSTIPSSSNGNGSGSS